MATPTATSDKGPATTIDSAAAATTIPFEPLVAVVDFHHHRGPEIEFWLGAKDGVDPGLENEWDLLPFMALSDGSHASTEDFSYFTLRNLSTPMSSSLFGIACTRQLPASELIERPPEVTRSVVQKAIVVVTDEPRHFGMLREKLSVVTAAWFGQKDFTDIDILKKFQESLAISLQGEEGQKDQYLGLSLREMVHEFKYQTLVLFKCLLLQPKMLFFGTRCERLCMIQFSLISLIPGLIRALEDCADPAFGNYQTTVVKPTSLKTSERSSLLAYMGLPLQIFGKGSFFGPYTPLQQLDMLADHDTKSYVVGSTNSLLLQQKDHYSDILINLDQDTISITSPSLKNALSLSAADRRWIDFIVQSVNETWDESNPSRPSTMGYMGSEEFIRLQFEEYLLALLSCESYHQHLEAEQPHHNRRRSQSPSSAQSRTPPPSKPERNESDTSYDFNDDFLHQWRQTSNYKLFSSLTSDALLFSIVEPRHPCAGGLNIDDIQRRLAQQVSELHLDERVREGKEVLNKHLATGQKKVSTAFNSLWADIEAMREAQRKKAEERAAKGDSSDPSTVTSPTNPPSSYSLPWASLRKSTDNPPTSAGSSTKESILSTPAQETQPVGAALPNVDLTAAQANLASASQKAGAYISSWGAWASERKKEWNDKRSESVSAPTPAPKKEYDYATNENEARREQSSEETKRPKAWALPFRRSVGPQQLVEGGASMSGSNEKENMAPAEGRHYEDTSEQGTDGKQDHRPEVPMTEIRIVPPSPGS